MQYTYIVIGYKLLFIVQESFTKAELEKFTKRYENGYDLLIDKRYNKWLELHHQEEYGKLIGNSGV